MSTQPMKEPSEPGVYFAARSDSKGQREAVEVRPAWIGVGAGFYVRAFNGRNYECSQFVDYVKAIDPLEQRT